LPSSEDPSKLLQLLKISGKSASSIYIPMAMPEELKMAAAGHSPASMESNNAKAT
jgi:hypothetical protein